MQGNVYIADTNNCVVRKITVSTGIISTIAGAGFELYGTGHDCAYYGNYIGATSALLNYPYGVAIDSSGTTQIECL